MQDGSSFELQPALVEVKLEQKKVNSQQDSDTTGLTHDRRPFTPLPSTSIHSTRPALIADMQR